MTGIPKRGARERARLGVDGGGPVMPAFGALAMPFDRLSGRVLRPSAALQRGFRQFCQFCQFCQVGMLGGRAAVKTRAGA